MPLIDNFSNLFITNKYFRIFATASLVGLCLSKELSLFFDLEDSIIFPGEGRYYFNPPSNSFFSSYPCTEIGTLGSSFLQFHNAVTTVTYATLCSTAASMMLQKIYDEGLILQLASYTGYTRYVRFITNSVDVNPILLQKCLGHSIRGGHVNLVKLLITNKIMGINYQDEHLDSPIYTAVASGQTECLALLVRAGADLRLRRHDGYEPIHTAAWYGNKECIEYLLTQGVSPSETIRREILGSTIEMTPIDCLMEGIRTRSLLKDPSVQERERYRRSYNRLMIAIDPAYEANGEFDSAFQATAEIFWSVVDNYMQNPNVEFFDRLLNELRATPRLIVPQLQANAVIMEQALDLGVINNQEIDIAYKCLITGCIMTDPVYIRRPDCSTQGQRYERIAIEAWLRRIGTDPLTREDTRLADYTLQSDNNLRAKIEDFMSSVQQRIILESPRGLGL